MKKSILYFCVMALIFASCSSRKGAVTTTKVSKSTISNTWTVTDVRLEGFPAGYQIKDAFGMAPYQDFRGSTWKLYGGYSGYITLSNGQTQNIQHWLAACLSQPSPPSSSFPQLPILVVKGGGAARVHDADGERHGAPRPRHFWRPAARRAPPG